MKVSPNQRRTVLAIQRRRGRVYRWIMNPERQGFFAGIQQVFLQDLPWRDLIVWKEP